MPTKMAVKLAVKLAVMSPVCPKPCPKLKEVQLKKIVSVIDYLFRTSGSITELMDCAGEKNKSRFRKTILKPLVDTSLVEPTIKGMPRARRIFIFHKENEANVEKDIYEIMDMLRFGFGRWNEMMTYPFPFKFLQEYLDDASEIAFSKHWSEITAKGQI